LSDDILKLKEPEWREKFPTESKLPNKNIYKRRAELRIKCKE